MMTMMITLTGVVVVVVVVIDCREDVSQQLASQQHLTLNYSQ